MSKSESFIDTLTSTGEISFTLDRYCNALKIKKSAGLASLSRLKKQHKIASPSKGYYLILTPEFRSRGCLPAEFFIDDLMKHLGVDYYVCLLSAAMFYGAAHQQPQMMQVMVKEHRQDIECGNVLIQFIQNTHSNKTAVRQLKTRTGYLNVSTPEATAKDLMLFTRQAGGMNRVVTVIDELAESINAHDLENIAKSDENGIWIRRLGYILDTLGNEALSDVLYNYFDKSANIAPLIPYEVLTNYPRSKKWRIAINAKIESDLDDTN